MTEFWIQLGLGALIIGAAFAFLWRQGYLARLATYVSETRDELKKCAWPTREELWRTTVLIVIVFGAMGLFTVGIDFIVLRLVRALL